MTGRPKKDSDELTRAALESFLWNATGWRGDAIVIDGILAKIDIYAANRVRQAGLAAQERAEAVAVSAEAGKMTSELPPEAPISERLLNALVDAMEATRSATTHASRAVLAIEIAAQAIRDAQDMAEAGKPSETPVRPTAEQRQAAEEYLAEYETEHGPIPDEAWAEADKILGVDRKLPESLGTGEGPGDLSEREAFTEEDLGDDAEADAIVDAILNGVEAQPETPVPTSGEDGKRCRDCEQWKLYGEFYKDNSLSDGYMNRCKRCDAKKKTAKRLAARKGDAEVVADKLMNGGGE